VLITRCVSQALNLNANYYVRLPPFATLL